MYFASDDLFEANEKSLYVDCIAFTMFFKKYKGNFATYGVIPLL